MDDLGKGKMIVRQTVQERYDWLRRNLDVATNGHSVWLYLKCEMVTRDPNAGVPTIDDLLDFIVRNRK